MVARRCGNNTCTGVTFKVVKHIPTTVDSQPFPDGAIFVQVMGQLKADEDKYVILPHTAPPEKSSSRTHTRARTPPQKKERGKARVRLPFPVASVSGVPPIDNVYNGTTLRTTAFRRGPS